MTTAGIYFFVQPQNTKYSTTSFSSDICFLMDKKNPIYLCLQISTYSSVGDSPGKYVGTKRGKTMSSKVNYIQGSSPVVFSGVKKRRAIN